MEVKEHIQNINIKNNTTTNDILGLLKNSQFLDIKDKKHKEESYHIMSNEIQKGNLILDKNQKIRQVLAPNKKQSLLYQTLINLGITEKESLGVRLYTRTNEFKKRWGYNWEIINIDNKFDLYDTYIQRQYYEYSNILNRKRLEQTQYHKNIYRQYIIHNDQAISSLNAKLGNNKFNIHKGGYGGIYDKNLEPLILARASQYTLNKNGKFVLGTRKDHTGNKYPVGVFFGPIEEVKYHANNKKKMGENVFFHIAFLRNKHFPILPNKPWSSKENVEILRKEFDGTWVNKYNFSDNKSIKETDSMIEFCTFDVETINYIGHIKDGKIIKS